MGVDSNSSGGCPGVFEWGGVEQGRKLHSKRAVQGVDVQPFPPSVTPVFHSGVRLVCSAPVIDHVANGQPLESRKSNIVVVRISYGVFFISEAVVYLRP